MAYTALNQPVLVSEAALADDVQLVLQVCSAIATSGFKLLGTSDPDSTFFYLQDSAGVYCVHPQQGTAADNVMAVYWGNCSSANVHAQYSYHCVDPPHSPPARGRGLWRGLQYWRESSAPPEPLACPR